jgi:hypothetical protein
MVHHQSMHFYFMSEFCCTKLCALIDMVSLLGAWNIHVWLIFIYFYYIVSQLVVYVAPNK